MTEYRICNRCIMDTTDPKIEFDEAGFCNHCKRYEQFERAHLHIHPAGRHKFEQMVHKIKQDGKNKEYDCIIGVSGGLDSTYAAYQAHKLGLRLLAVHVDNGWDFELAVSNIEKVLRLLDIELYTYVMNWEKFKELQLAFLRASVPDAEIPTDHAYKAAVLRASDEMNLPYIIRGTNVVTETIMPMLWSYDTGDWWYIQDVNRRFGTNPLKDYPHTTFMQSQVYRFVKRKKYICILDYVGYNKKHAIATLENELGWRYYGGKHYESIYTRFWQGYILPRKFNIDKRRAHLSTLIMSGQMTREEALVELENNPYSEEMMQADREYVIKKLGLTEKEFEEIMNLPERTFQDFRTQYRLKQTLRKFAGLLRPKLSSPSSLSEKSI